MKKEELFDLLGEIDDKFYKEAEYGDFAAESFAETVNPIGFLELSEVISCEVNGSNKKSRLRTIASAAAGVAVIVGAIFAAVMLSNGINSDLNDDVRYCRNYISAHYSNLVDNTDAMDYRVLDLNFDGEDEILLTAENYYCPVFVFGRQEEELQLISILGQKVHDSFLGTLDGLYPYENGEEKYYYYFFTFDEGADMKAKVAAAIKFDGENYRIGYLLSYGILSHEHSSAPNVKFFREGWHIMDTWPEAFTDIGEEAFTELWNQYEYLPPISFDDFKGNYSTKMLTDEEKLICEAYIEDNCTDAFTEEDTPKYYMFDLNFDGKEEIVISNDAANVLYIFEKTESEPIFAGRIGEEELGFCFSGGIFDYWGLFSKEWSDDPNIGYYIRRYYYFYLTSDFPEETGIKAKALFSIAYDGERYYAECVLSYGVLNYGQPAETCFFRDDFNIYELLSDTDYSTLKYTEFEKRWKTYYDLPSVDFSDISGYCETSSFEFVDSTQVPDIPGGGIYSEYYILPLENLRILANYTAMYHSFAKAILYTEEIGGYTFNLVGEEIRTDKSEDPDMIYCSDLYVIVTKADEIVESGISYMIPVELKDVHSLPIDGFYNYMPQIYELRDGIVIFTDYQDVSGWASPFITIKNDLLYPMYGNFTSLMDADGFYPDIEFTADYEENILYYDGMAFKFNFDKVGIDGETELFTVIEP